ncbi:MAG: hypothetical protein WC623_13525 [Pedobacter sp.]|uniref:hypothetical protein n=1 Tax=Pedobacter sp. TaxID=1411316 RepID=UPI00356A6478
MAYITKSNASRIIREIDFGKIKNFEGDVYGQRINLFSLKDKNILLAISKLYSNPDEFVNSKYEKIENIDTLSYVFEGGQPAYHAKLDCPKLISTFRNYEIPQEIKDKGKEEVLRFRKWFNENKSLLEKPDTYVMRLQAAFGIKRSAEEFEVGNSGVQENENLDLEDLTLKIDTLLAEIQEYYNKASDYKKYVIDNFIKSTSMAYTSYSFKNNSTKYTDEVLKKFLKQYDKAFKRPLKKLLRNYYRVKFNPNLKFEGAILEQLGFKKCAHCHGEEILEGADQN